MYQYMTGTDGTLQSILRLEDRAVIPLDEDNVDYAAFLAWRTAGNEPLQEPALTGGELLARAAAERAAKLAEANAAAMGLLHGFVLRLLTVEEETCYRAWADYALALVRLPQASGWPQAPAWPSPPNRPE